MLAFQTLKSRNNQHSVGCLNLAMDCNIHDLALEQSGYSPVTTGIISVRPILQACLSLRSQRPVPSHPHHRPRQSRCTEEHAWPGHGTFGTSGTTCQTSVCSVSFSRLALIPPSIQNVSLSFKGKFVWSVSLSE